MQEEIKCWQEEEIASLVKQFTECSLAKQAWTHQAHLIVSIWYSNHYQEEVLLDKMRSAIMRYNEAVGTPNTPTNGYHETITRFWLYITKVFLNTHDFESIATTCNHFIYSEFGKKDYLLNYYSKELLFSTKARLHWVKPDLKNLPTI